MLISVVFGILNDRINKFANSVLNGGSKAVQRIIALILGFVLYFKLLF